MLISYQIDHPLLNNIILEEYTLAGSMSRRPKSQIKIDGLQMDMQLIFSCTYGKEQSCIHFIMGLENCMALVKPYLQKLRLQFNDLYMNSKNVRK